MDQVKILALGGLDENGKNMYIVEVNDNIFIVEAGLKYPDSDQLGVECIIPDFTYLLNNKDKIRGIFITHGHDDVMGALGYLLKQINIPVYTGALTSLMIKDYLKKEGIKGIKINIVKKSQVINGITVRTFSMTHAFPDNFGLAIKTAQGYIVYSGEFIVDYDINSQHYACDINELSEIGKQGVLCLLNESIFADKSGHTAPKHRISEHIAYHFESSPERIIISCYEQSLFRIIEILDLALANNLKVYFHDKTIKRLLSYLEEMNYYKFPKQNIVSDKEFSNDLSNIVVLVTGSGKKLFRKMQNIAMHEDPLLNFKQNDTIIVASPMVSGTELDATNMENEIYKEGGHIYSLKSKTVLSMHPSSEDLKMMMYLFKPKYYLPIKGEYRHLIINADLATRMGYLADKILILDNGEIATFEKGTLKSIKNDLELHDTLIDGKENWDVTGVVLKDREVLSTDGVMVIGVSIDFKTKDIIGGPDVQTRGLIYLKEADYIIKEVSSITEQIIKEQVESKTYENLACRMLVRDKVVKYLGKETGKRPMVLPVIIEINISNEIKEG